MTYRISATDLLTGRRLAHDLPAVVEKWTERLNAPTSFAGTLSLDGGPGLWSVLEPRRTALWLWDRGHLVSGGILWQDDADVMTRDVRFGVAGHSSYLDRREIRDSLEFPGLDQLDIARALIDYAQGSADSAIGLRYDDTESPVIRDVFYDGGELKPVGEAIRHLGATSDGFDHRERFAVDDDGRPYCELEFGHPYLATVNRSVLFVFDHTVAAPSNLLQYKWPRDGTGSGNNLLLPGAGEGSARPRGFHVNTAEVNAGVPRLDWSTTEHQDVTDAQTLDALAREYGRVLQGCRVVPSATVGPDGPVLSSYRVGDVCRFRFTSVIHPSPRPGVPGLEVWLRITGRSITPASKDQEAGVELQLEGTPWVVS